jgi:GTPase
VLAEVGGDQIREVIVVNKADAADPEVLDRLRRSEKHSLIVSARTGEGLEELRALIADELPRPEIKVTVLLPYDRGDLVSRLHNEADIITSEHTEHGTQIEAKVNQTLVDELAAYAV